MRKTKKIPKFDGRPMLWMSMGDLIIRYGVKSTHKFDVLMTSEWETYMSEGKWAPEYAIRFGDEFLGYL